VAEDTVQPVTMLRAYGWIVAFTSIAVGTVRIVADSEEAVPPGARVDKAVVARPQESLVGAGTPVELVVVVAVPFMR
jgi:hypothetical protein